MQNAPRYEAPAQTRDDPPSVHSGPKPRGTVADRAFWVFLSQVWSGWKEILVIVQPETVVRWHRKGEEAKLPSGFYWQSISKRGPGRPPIPGEVQALIRLFANENGWRARKVGIGKTSCVSSTTDIRHSDN